MSLIRKSELVAKASASSGYNVLENIRKYSAEELLLEKRAADLSHKSYDIFLSHSYEDAANIRGLRDLLKDAGYTVYVDWIDDPQLSRGNVTKATAAVLRGRMDSCRCLLYATSDAAKKSIWMPWELGYMDAKTKARVAVVPIIDDASTQSEYKGQEYLGLYPYLDRTSGNFYVQTALSKYVTFKDWLNGANPSD